MMDLTQFEALIPYAAVGLIGSFLGWLSYRFKTVFMLVLFMSVIAIGFIGKQFLPSINLRGVNPAEVPSAIVSAFSETARALMVLGVVAAIAARLLTSYLIRFGPSSRAESRGQMRKRLYKDFSYEDTLTRAMTSKHRSTETVVVPWAAANEQPTAERSRRT